MSRRDNWNEDQKAAERDKNRLRMARYRQDPKYRERVNAQRAHQDRARKAADPDLRSRLNASKKRYFEKRKSDPAFWQKRHDYLRRWRAERRIDEEFDAFMSRIKEADYAEPV